MASPVQDIRYALRALRRSPGFTAVAVLTFALGIGATTALFSVVNAVLLRPLPYPDAGRIVQIWQLGDGGAQNFLSDANFHDLRQAGRSFAAMAEYGGGEVSVAGGSEPVRAGVAAVSEEFFEVMGVRPARGRLFLPEERREGAAPAVLVSHDFWVRSLGSDPAFSRRTLRFDGRVYQVAGVMPAGFAFPAGAALWTPRELEPVFPSRTAQNWEAVGRLRPGVAPEQARAELSAVARRLKAELGDETWMSDADVVPLYEQVVGKVRPALLLLLGAAGLLLLIAVINLAYLLLARAAARRREMAVRAAVGAGRGRLVRQMVTEALAVTLAGWAAGWVMAVWGVRALVALRPDALPRVDEVGVSGVGLALSLAVAVGVATMLGSLAALRSTRGGLRAVLAEGDRGQGGSVSGRRMRAGLVMAQIALTLVLLTSAGVLGRSFMRLMAVDPGFRTGGALVMKLSLPAPQDDAEKARLAALLTELMGRLRALPGVTHVGGVNQFPLGQRFSNGTFLVLNRPDEVTSSADFGRLAGDPSRAGDAHFRLATPDYFAAMEIPVLRGRVPDERDAPGAPHVAVISRSLAEARWPGEDPVGKLIQFGNMDGDFTPLTVVGVVGDIRERGLDAEPLPTVYASALQRPGRAGSFHMVITGTHDPASFAPAARAILRRLSPDEPPVLSTLDEMFASSVAERRFTLLLLGAFAAAELLLAVAGVYGVTSYMVSQRTREFGIRMALGARVGDVLRMVVRQGAVLALGGVAAGLAIALASNRLLASLVYGVSVNDTATYVAVPLLLTIAAVAASLAPAHRAARVDPVVALRAE